VTTSSRDHLTREQDALLRAELLRIAAANHPLSVRALYYQAVLNPALPFLTKDADGSRRSERLVAGRCLELRRSGAMPWEWITDPSRASYEVERFGGLAPFAAMAPWYYRRDLWADQGQRPIVMVEKAAAISTVLQHCNEAGVDVWATKGYGSATQLKDIALAAHPLLERGQDVVALVLADFDPSGWGWPQSAEAEIRSHLDRLGPVAVGIHFERLLMTEEQAAGLGHQVALRAANPKDRRTKAFLERFSLADDSEACVELDALAPVEVRSLLTDRFEDLFDGDLTDEQDQQQADRERIRQALVALS
jgi:hypothetical protein